MKVRHRDGERLIQAYSLPHECETEAVTQALMQLDARKRRVVRSYVWSVEISGKLIDHWLADKTTPVSRAAWYRTGGSNYMRNEDFAAAVELYTAAVLRFRTRREQSLLDDARHQIIDNALAAVDETVNLMQFSESDSERGKAAERIVKWSGLDKSSEQAATRVEVKGYEVVSPDDWDEAE